MSAGTSDPVVPARHGDVIAVIGMLVLAWALYRPEVPRPFDYIDFPENIRVLESGESFHERWRALVHVYAAHGRWSPITLATLALQWSWFEWWVPGWHLLRFLLSSASLVLAYRLCRRLEFSIAGAVAATALLIISPAAVTGWTRLSTGEPLALLFLALACHVAIRPPSWRSNWTLAVLLLCVMWTKEIVTVAFLLPLALTATSIGGQLGRPRWNSAFARSFLPLSTAFVLGAVPILATWWMAPRDAFARRYGAGGVDPAEIAGAALATWLPFAPSSTEPATSLLIAVGAYAVLVLAGWYAALRTQAAGREHRLVVLWLALSIPVIGALLYAPWPFYILVYALPFQLAGLLLPGQAATSLLRGGAAARGAALLCLTTAGSFGAAQAANQAASTRALEKAFASTVRHVSSLGGVDTVLVGVAPNQLDVRGNFGPRFALYAQMMGVRWPRTRDVACPEAVAGEHVAVLKVSAMCPTPGSSPASVVVAYSRFVWPNPLPVRDSMTVYVEGPR